MKPMFMHPHFRQSGHMIAAAALGMQVNMQAGRLESTLTLFIHTAHMHPVITVLADLELHRFCPVLPGFLPL